MRISSGCWRRKCDCFAWFSLDWGLQCWNGMGRAVPVEYGEEARVEWGTCLHAFALSPCL